MNAREHSVTQWLADRADDMTSLLAELVNIDSGTRNRDGVNAVAARLSRFFADHSVERTAIPGGSGYGDGLRAEVSGRSLQPGVILLMGHLDTVFPEGEAARRPFQIVDERAFGPGVADMKGGVVMNSFVLAALQACGGTEAKVVGLFSGDEEVGSPFYRPIVEREAAQADFALNAEPGRISGNVVNERRGGVFMRLSVKGKAAHSGMDLRQGISAIEEIAQKVIALHALTDFERNVTVNVGVVTGGQSVNTSAPSAEALIDLRIPTPEERTRVMRAIEDIVARSWVPGATATLAVMGEFLPLVPTPAASELLDVYRQAAEELGLSVSGEASGACADSGLAAAAGAVTLCGTGPVGTKSHTPDEYIELPTLLSRAQALALTILRLPTRAGGNA